MNLRGAPVNGRSMKLHESAEGIYTWECPDGGYISAWGEDMEDSRRRAEATVKAMDERPEWMKKHGVPILGHPFRGSQVCRIDKDNREVETLNRKVYIFQ